MKSRLLSVPKFEYFVFDLEKYVDFQKTFGEYCRTDNETLFNECVKKHNELIETIKEVKKESLEEEVFAFNQKDRMAAILLEQEQSLKILEELNELKNIKRLNKLNNTSTFIASETNKQKPKKDNDDTMAAALLKQEESLEVLEELSNEFKNIKRPNKLKNNFTFITSKSNKKEPKKDKEDEKDILSPSKTSK